MEFNLSIDSNREFNGSNSYYRSPSRSVRVGRIHRLQTKICKPGIVLRSLVPLFNQDGGLFTLRGLNLSLHLKLDTEGPLSSLTPFSTLPLSQRRDSSLPYQFSGSRSSLLKKVIHSYLLFGVLSKGSFRHLKISSKHRFSRFDRFKTISRQLALFGHSFHRSKSLFHVQSRRKQSIVNRFLFLLLLSSSLNFVTPLYISEFKSLSLVQFRTSSIYSSIFPILIAYPWTSIKNRVRAYIDFRFVKNFLFFRDLLALDGKHQSPLISSTLKPLQFQNSSTRVLFYRGSNLYSSIKKRQFL